MPGADLLLGCILTPSHRGSPLSQEVAALGAVLSGRLLGEQTQ